MKVRLVSGKLRGDVVPRMQYPGRLVVPPGARLYACDVELPPQLGAALAAASEMSRVRTEVYRWARDFAERTFPGHSWYPDQP